MYRQSPREFQTLLVLGVTLLCAPALVMAEATVTTDQADYVPGQTVVITGTGWEPGETVELEIITSCGCPVTVLFAVADAAGNILLREKLPTPQGTSFPRPNQFYSHGYVNEMNDAVECVLDARRHPQSGPLMAWDTMAVLMAGYESAEREGVFVDVGEYCGEREFKEEEMPDPHAFGSVFQRV